MVERYPETVKVVFKNFPLRNHAQAMPAARAAVAAQAQGRFWPFDDQIFANGRQLGPELYEKIAAELKLDLESFNRVRNARSSYEQVAADFRLGQSVGVRGTPAVYVNGLLLEERTPEALQRMIEAELSR